jgi:uncharacterized protein (TIGR03083 family)
MGLREMIAAERTDLLGFLETLSPDDWETPSLCERWRIRDVVAHLLWDSFPLLRCAVVCARYRSPDRINQHYVDQARDLPTAELLVVLESTIRGGGVGRLMPAGVLADLVVHHQDVRRPLGRPRTIEPARLEHALRHPNRFAYPRRLTRALRFCADDLDWAQGTGPQIRGPAEALALALAGRPCVLDELRGDGVAVLAARMDASASRRPGRSVPQRVPDAGTAAPRYAT